ncbi:MAG TPA: hypothetical protein VF677_03775, partial [Flavobacterium sp.]
ITLRMFLSKNYEVNLNKNTNRYDWCLNLFIRKFIFKKFLRKSYLKVRYVPRVLSLAKEPAHERNITPYITPF